MAILKLLRVTMHPWTWWVIVRRSLENFVSERMNLETRRRIAAILQTFDARMHPDDSVVECPYLRLPTQEIEDRHRRNTEIRNECVDRTGRDPRQVESVTEVVGGQVRVVKHGYRPVPDPHLEASIDFSKDDVALITKAIEKHAEGALSHTLDQGFADAIDALAAGEVVEIDTELAARPKPTLLPGETPS